jgi:hypothetical protein
MARPKGLPKTGGRKAGTPNKRRPIAEMCEELGLDPFKEMAKIGSDLEHEKRFEALKELCQYLEPKRKAVEVSGEMDLRVKQELESLMGLSEEQLIEMAKQLAGK